MIRRFGRIRFAASLLLILALALSGCRGSESENAYPPPGTLLPQEEDIPADSEVDHIVGRDTSDLSAAVRGLRSQLTRAETLLVAGVEKGRYREMIGRVQDAAVARSGPAYVLDRENNQIRLYEPETGLRAVVGREGKGPTEFTDIWAVDWLGSGRLLVSDSQAGVKILSIEDTTLSLVETIQGDGLIANDVCAIDKQIFAHQARVEAPSGVIHKYDFSGRRDTSFGEMYPGPKIISWDMSEGMMGCHAATETVLFAFDSLPVVRAFTSEGDRKWTLKTREFEPVFAEFQRSEDGSPAMGYERPSEFNLPFRFHTLSDRHVLYQVRQFEMSDDGDRIESRSFHNYVIDVISGRAHYIGTEPGGLFDLSAGYGIGETSADFPQIAITRFEGLARP